MLYLYIHSCRRCIFTKHHRIIGVEEMGPLGRVLSYDEVKVVNVMVLPYPVQGHINPMLHFAKRLLATGRVSVTFVTTEKARDKIMKSNKGDALLSSMKVELFSNGLGDDNTDWNHDADKCRKTVLRVGSETLSKLLERLNSTGQRVSCMVYDSFLYWVPDVAAQFGIPSAFVWTQSCAVYSIYYHAYFNNDKGCNDFDGMNIPGLPVLEEEELPSFLQKSNTQDVIRECVLDQFEAVPKVRWILGNSFHQLEESEISSVPAYEHRLRTVGPLVPSAYLDGRIPDDTDSGAHLWKASDKCTEWLDSKPPQSVIYVSFGSLAVLSEEQIHEIAYGLQRSGYPFLWVIRPSDKGKDSFGLSEEFLEETEHTGMVVPWCSQLQVLSHPAIGGFVSHCGWNSTIEAISQGVPVLGVPQWSDQTTNVAYASKVWKNGVRLKREGDGMVKREEVERGIRLLTESPEGAEIRRNACRLEQAAKTAMVGGGSSDVNIQRFVNELAVET